MVNTRKQETRCTQCDATVDILMQLKDQVADNNRAIQQLTLNTQQHKSSVDQCLVDIQADICSSQAAIISQIMDLKLKEVTGRLLTYLDCLENRSDPKISSSEIKRVLEEVVRDVANTSSLGNEITMANLTFHDELDEVAQPIVPAAVTQNHNHTARELTTQATNVPPAENSTSSAIVQTDNWQTVQPRKRKKKNSRPIPSTESGGTSVNSDIAPMAANRNSQHGNGVKAARKWIFVTNLDPCVTVSSMKAYAAKKCRVSPANVQCELLSARARNNQYLSFKISLQNDSEKLLKIWSKGIIAREFSANRGFRKEQTQRPRRR